MELGRELIKQVEISNPEIKYPAPTPHGWRKTQMPEEKFQKKIIHVLNCTHLPLLPCAIVCRRLTHLFVSNRMQTIAYGCRGNSEQEHMYYFFVRFKTYFIDSIYLFRKSSRSGLLSIFKAK
ncbi:hypothetical protein SAMN05421659_112145 [[Clostridium] fimetarium]|uniref:Uncharacterized protein n=1 Tax=[Clostridium] fimetarium TaxID=99656 RepID=A0A1I0R867_9FIRM|nr:hypothetical protein SAMN05421659_112145 [[Clostridium] fimetarium]